MKLKMKSTLDMGLIGLTIIFIVIASVIAITTNFIWLINPPNSKPNGSKSEIIPNLYSQTNPSIPLLDIKITTQGGLFYTPQQVMYTDISLIGNNIPSTPLDQKGTQIAYEILSFNVSVIYFIFDITNPNKIVFLQTQNKSFILDGVNDSYNHQFLWNPGTYNNFFRLGQRNFNISIPGLFIIQTTKKSNNNGIIYTEDEEFGSSLIRYHTNNGQVIIDGFNYPASNSKPMFTYVEWNPVSSSIIIGGLVILAIIPLMFFIKQKYMH